MTKLVVNKQHAQSTLDSVLASIGIYDELAPRILPKAKFQVWDVGDKGLEKYQHGSHGSYPSECIALDGGARLINGCVAARPTPLGQAESVKFSLPNSDSVCQGLG